MTYERRFQECPWRTSSGECTNKNIPSRECKTKLKNCKTYKEWDSKEKFNSELPMAILEDIYNGARI